ncbi:MAG: hypothetical protein GFH27_549283n400 [Chloroflexi bacterium AL-W]|nr:hypothetical protein [Chloroflexi bacterium AL-N1]NOK64479.1 hypothetical protein [Chloroflexi bacterium AL-N10]NOK75721.1 hypothetical protein [Chloroflexi bacterium AL-N5]NOK80521.1 hypothetical protein [Chloroflexi bacterium AL-W]NOK87035.1 hypothetical protein [Chloroflexi bacterium AL-N15]
MASASRSSSRLVKILVLIAGGIGGGVVFCCLLGLVLNLLGQPVEDYEDTVQVMQSEVSTTEPTATPAPTEVATTAPLATVAPRPTERPVEPSPTTEPTPVPPTIEPTPIPPTPEPAISSEVQAYTLAIYPYVDSVGQALGEMSYLLLNPSINDDTWRTEMIVQIMTIRTAHSELSDMDNIPGDMQNIHNSLTGATGDCDAMTHSLVRGIDNENVADIEEAARYMEGCTEKIEYTTLLMNDYMAAYD